MEDANIKLSSVLSNSFGVSGSAIIAELLKGSQTTEEMAGLARGRLKPKKEQIKEALRGNFQEHHRFMIEASLEHINSIELIISKVDLEIDKKIEGYREEYELLQTIPGVKEQGATAIIAEIGADMGRFPTEEHLASWAGMSPGNNESAGKKKRSYYPRK